MLLVSDELIGTNCPNSSIKYISSKEMFLDEARSVIKSELKGHEQGPVLVAVGSYHISASYNGWTPESIDGCEVQCVKDALICFEKELHRFSKLSRKFGVKISICSLIPLPNEQDCDNTPSRKAFLTHIISKLFVKANEAIEQYNNAQHVTTLKLKKFMDEGNHNFYMTGQRKIKKNKYNEKGLPNARAVNILMNKSVDKIISLSRDVNNNFM